MVPEGQRDLEVGLAPAPRRTVHLASAAVLGGGNAYVTSALIGKRGVTPKAYIVFKGGCMNSIQEGPSGI